MWDLPQARLLLSPRHSQASVDQPGLPCHPLQSLQWPRAVRVCVEGSGVHWNLQQEVGSMSPSETVNAQ